MLERRLVRQRCETARVPERGRMSRPRKIGADWTRSITSSLTEDFDSLPSSAVTFFYSTRRAGITIHIAVSKRNPAERLLTKYVPRRRFSVLAKIKARRRNDESMPPTIQNGSSDISLGVKTRAREHLHKLFRLPHTQPPGLCKKVDSWVAPILGSWRTAL